MSRGGEKGKVGEETSTGSIGERGLDNGPGGYALVQ